MWDTLYICNIKMSCMQGTMHSKFPNDSVSTFKHYYLINWEKLKYFKCCYSTDKLAYVMHKKTSQEAFDIVCWLLFKEYLWNCMFKEYVWNCMFKEYIWNCMVFKGYLVVGLGAFLVERSFFAENERNDQERSHRSEKNERLDRVRKNIGTIKIKILKNCNYFTF